MGRQNQPHKKRHNKSPVAALFVGGSSLIFATFVFFAPAMPRLNPATLNFPTLHANMEASSSSPRHENFGTTKNHDGGVPAERDLGTEPSKETWVMRNDDDVLGRQGAADTKNTVKADVFLKKGSVSSSRDGVTHERMDAPFGSRIEHSSELLSNVNDPRRIQVLSLDNPRAFLYKRFMSDAECDFMVVG